MVSDFGHPGQGGRGSKKGKFLQTSSMDGPLLYACSPISFSHYGACVPL